MKGASATKMLLEATLLKAHSRVAQESPMSWMFPEVLMCYEMTCREAYNVTEPIAKAIDLAGQSLRKKGHVYYLGWGSLGKMGLIDASECVPTFSAHFDDVRGFLFGGYGALKNREGEVHVGNKILLGMEDFVESFLPKLDSSDTVVLIFSDKEVECELENTLHLLAEKRATLVGLYVHSQCSDEENSLLKTSSNFHVLVKVDVPLIREVVRVNCNGSLGILESHLIQCLQEIAAKWVLNAVSTGAHILKGKVLRGFMIDVKIGNSKLFYRAVEMVSKFAKVDREKAFISILQAIYRTENLSDDQRMRDVSEHVRHGTRMSMVVPLAVLLATDTLSMEKALDALQNSTTAKVLKKHSLL